MADHGGRQRTRRERMRGGRKGRSYVWQSRGGRDEGVGGGGGREGESQAGVASKECVGRAVSGGVWRAQ